MTVTKREQISDRRQKIETATAEQNRLLRMLEYYAWLEEWKLSYDVIAGTTAPIPLSTVIRQEIKNYARSIGRWNDDLREFFQGRKSSHSLHRFHPKAISYRLKDGREVVLPFPPFPHNVVYNDPNHTEDWTKSVAVGQLPMHMKNFPG